MPFFQHDSVNLFYTSQGDGPPVLLLHGYACDSHDWSFQIPYLLKLNFRVIALDQRGHGRSSAPQDPSEYALRKFADDAVALIEHLDVEPVILMAHSMGTIIASIIAVEYPEVVKALVLAHPIYSGASPRLPLIAQTMHETPNLTGELAQTFFSQAMYTPQTPEWLKTWQLRRALGGDPVMLVGCLDAIVDLYGSVMGQSEEAKKFMRRRKMPRLAIGTNVVPAAAAWEIELGVEDGLDDVQELSEGTFSHMVVSVKFNMFLSEWLKRKQMLPPRKYGGESLR